MAVPSERCYECGCTERQNPEKPFCMHCGHQRDHHTAICGRCHQLLGDSTAFCQHCGEPIEREGFTPPYALGATPSASSAPSEPVSTPPPPRATATPPATPPEPNVRSSACTSCGCPTFRFVSASSGCGTCGHYAAAHNLGAEDIAALSRGEQIKPSMPRAAVPVGPPAGVGAQRPLSVSPKGLIAAAWVAGIFAALSILVGIAAYSDSSSTSTDTFGGSVQSAADTATLVAGIGVGAFWLMICCFCVGLHGHLDRIARATIETSERVP